MGEIWIILSLELLVLVNTCATQLLINDSNKNKAKKSVMFWSWVNKTGFKIFQVTNLVATTDPHKISHDPMPGRDPAVEKP